MTLIGHLVAAILTMTGFHATKFLFGKYFVVGSGWGGVSFGPVAVVSKDPGEYILCHEYGHSLQNCMYGFLFPFIVAIPSFIRYWRREFLVKTRGMRYSDLPDYDSVWFEGQATELGLNAYKQSAHSG